MLNLKGTIRDRGEKEEWLVPVLTLAEAEKHVAAWKTKLSKMQLDPDSAFASFSCVQDSQNFIMDSWCPEVA